MSNLEFVFFIRLLLGPALPEILGAFGKDHTGVGEYPGGLA